MELEGTIVFDLPLTEGVSKAGRAWKKKEWVLETPGMYPRRVKFHVFGDRVDYLNFEVGKSYAITFELESREFNGRWYTDVNCLAARPLDGSGTMNPDAFTQQPAATLGQQMSQPAAPVAPTADPFAGGDNNTDDLPF